MGGEAKQRYTLQKLGEAYYKHKKLAEIANKAAKAATYLGNKGVL